MASSARPRLAPCLAALLLLACSCGAAVTAESRADADTDSAAPPDTAAERDSDGDGLVDPVDACPSEAEDSDGFEDEDGCPDNDNDGDGIADEADLCPNHDENWNAYLDEDGCPDVHRVRGITMPAVEFAPDEAQTEILAVQFEMFDALIEDALREDPDVVFAVLGSSRRPDSIDGLRCARARFLLDSLVTRGYEARRFAPYEDTLGDPYAALAPASDQLLRYSVPCELSEPP